MVGAWELKPEGAPGALAAAAVTGAGITALPFVLAGPWVVLAFVIAMIPWLIGVALFGPPLWWLLHRYTDRGLAWFALAGAGATSAGALPLGLTVGGWRPEAVPGAIVFTVIMAMLGAVAGVVIREVGYRKTAQDTEVFQ